MQETMIDYKQNIYQELSRLTKGLGSEKRLDILNILSQGPKTVEGIGSLCCQYFAPPSGFKRKSLGGDESKW